MEERIAPPQAPTARLSAASGVMAFAAFAVRNDARLIWFDRTGKRLGEAAPPGVYVNPELSKDDRFVLVSREFGVVGDETVLLKASTPISPLDWSLDGRYVAFVQDGDAWVLEPSSGKPIHDRWIRSALAP